VNRRNFFKSGGAAALAGTLPAKLGAAPAAATARSFPPGFIWGSATAAYQVEGAANEDGRGPSVWDTWSHVPGHVVNNDTGDVADDFYHRYKEDVALMKDLGLRGCRFSISWPRVFPQGAGTPNPKGVDFYKRLVDELRNAGIQPFCTLFHWDLPQALEDKGGWTSRDTAKVFADYAGYMAGQLADRIDRWMTINEFASYIDGGYGPHPYSAPQRQITRGELAQTRHYAVLAHGLAVGAIRASAKRPVQVGIAENTSGAAPAIETADHIAAAAKALRLMNASYTTVIMEGKYPQQYLDSLGADAPHFTAEELKTISAPLDFFGLNVYTTTPVLAADNPRGFVPVPRPKSYPHAVSEWLAITPEALYWTPKLMADVWGLKDIYITENGCSCADTVNAQGQVLDSDRVFFLRAYLTELQRAVTDGVPVKGYFVWSLLDNFEWAQGYSQRFGITYVDYKTQKRTPKLSAEFYKQVIAKNALA
jgi:beta-glucosidase